MNKWKDVAHRATAVGLRVFPIEIKPHETKPNKFDKVPLTKHGHKDASSDVDSFDWSRANGFGIPMGDGFYALDVDDYKGECEAESWMEDFGVSKKTRIHTTVSGGRHYLYRLPAGVKVRTRAGVVAGLDSRGEGGWIAFGDGYGLVGESGAWDLAVLPKNACKELNEGGKEGSGKLDDWAYVEPDAQVMLEKLHVAIARSPHLLLRKLGSGDGIAGGRYDRSSMDHSVARLLWLLGFDQNEIVWSLENWFPHGKCGGDFSHAKRRWAKRNAGSCGGNRMTVAYDRDELYATSFKPVMTVMALVKGKEPLDRLAMMYCVIGALGKSEASFEKFFEWVCIWKKNYDKDQIRKVWDMVDEEFVGYGWPNLVHLYEGKGGSAMDFMSGAVNMNFEDFM